MRLAAIDIDDFRRFIEARGAVVGKPNTAAGEIIRFKVGRASGAVAKNNNGRIALSSAAIPLFKKYQAQQRERRIRERATPEGTTNA